jgi:hypothetical protein
MEDTLVANAPSSPASALSKRYVRGQRKGYICLSNRWRPVAIPLTIIITYTKRRVTMNRMNPRWQLACASRRDLCTAYLVLDMAELQPPWSITCSSNETSSQSYDKKSTLGRTWSLSIVRWVGTRIPWGTCFSQYVTISP